MKRNHLFAVSLGSLLMIWGIHFATNHIQQYASITGHTIPASEGPSALVRSLRPTYPYSVIPGGVYSPAELSKRIKDTVVREHYSDFDVQHTKLVRLTDDRYQYVSYRLKDQVYWTKKKLRIPKGELLLTDGQSYARARCGNRLSDKPHRAETNAQEPDTKVLSLPPVDQDLLPKLALSPTISNLSDNTPLALDPGTGDPQTDAGVPGELTPAPNSDPAVLSSSPETQPIVNGVLIPGSPLVPYNVTPGPLVPSASTSSPISGTTASTGNTPLVPTATSPGAPPAEVTPVPEPDRIYFFLVCLVISLWGMLQDSPKKQTGRSS